MMPLPPPIRRTAPRGVALVLVLSILVLVTVLVIAFFSMVTGELTSSKAYAGGAQAKQLSDSVVQLVMSQVTQATTNGTNTAWTSQPGMIRTFDDTGKAANFYKLYSSPQMIVAGSTFMSASSETPAYGEWNTKPALYSDLNQPVLVRDPAGAIVPDAADPGAKYAANYPILDPAAVGNVEGFNIFTTGTAPAGYAAAPTGYAGVYPPPGSYNPVASPNPAPMPVKWLYVLQSGAFAVPTDVDASGALGFLNTAAPSKDDPIVGRVAFWTDDETCKLNVNTASEGSCFDVPRATIQNEIQLALGQPVQNEYQRMPGHPATTCLSPALGWISGLQHPVVSADKTLFTGGIGGNYKVAKAYYDIAPRVSYLCNNQTQDLTSQAGTVNQSSVNPGSTTAATYAVNPDGDRLYASLDEMVFNPIWDPTAKMRQSNPSTTSPVITKQALDQAKFFLTASSRAPETTLFNTPRIGLWPLQKNTAARDAKDKLLQFCTELGVNATTGSPNQYYFQRYLEGKLDSQPNGFDWNKVATYPITQIPSSMSSTSDYTQIPRNQRLYSYLQKLTQRPIPGYGGDFATKWTKPGRDQVLTEMFDLIRSGLAQEPSGLSGGYHYPMPPDNLHCERFVAPITIDTTSSGGGKTKGFGRFHTVVEAAIVFYATKSQNATKPDPANPGGTISLPPGADPYLPLQTTEMQAVLLLMPFHPMPGMFNWSPFCRYEIKFGGGFALSVNGGGPSQPFADSTNRVSVRMGNTAGIGCIFPLFGLWSQFQVGGVNQNKFKGITPGSSNEDDDYPFCTIPVSVPIPTTAGTMSTFNFSGGTLTLNIRGGAGPAASSEIYQTIKMTFPPITNMTVPQTIYGATSRSWSQRLNTPDNGSSELRNTFNGRTLTTKGIIQEGDIVQAVEVDTDPNGPVKGDWRLIAGMPDVPASYFHPHPDYGSTIQPYKSTLLDYYNSITGTLTAPDTNSLAAARYGRFAHSLRSSGFPDTNSDFQYGIGNGAKNATATNRNNIASYPYGGNNINFTPTTASTLQGSGATATGVPNPGGLVAGITYNNKDTPIAAHGVTEALNSNKKPGDWDSGAGAIPDGPYINKPDPGNLNSGNGNSYWTSTTSVTDYGAGYSPNRQVASPVMFGSLPTPTSAGELAPWQTLLFCPNPASGGSKITDHYGFGDPGSIPPDYLMLDLFTMPVVEPYAISEPLSTAGKVNLNYQIEPFNFIRRDTAMRGVLKSMQMGAIPNTVTAPTTTIEKRYKAYTMASGTSASDSNYNVQTRFNLNLDETNGTLAGFEKKFATNDVFRSAAEVCSIFLVPMGPSTNPTYANVSDVANGWWKDYKLTGDNMREAPYNQIYPRVTARSNTFTVHYRVQILQKSPTTPANNWVESRDQVISEYRGSTLIERHIDPSDPKLPDFADPANSSAKLDNYYQMRIISSKKF